MNAYSFHDLPARAKENALSLYWREALASTLIERPRPGFVNVSFLSGCTFSITVTDAIRLEDIAGIVLRDGWLFNHLGERIA